ncbi:DNA-binding protein, partial [Klebsiella pneumoniae]|nr:DNA-binding protein [Klebsiella pneumoniae]
VYSINDLQAWADRGLVTSTSDPSGNVPPAQPQKAASLAVGRTLR